jgi:hypothetical protein
MDEKGFLLGVINRKKRVFDVNAKRQGKLLGASQDGNRSWITFLACICQDMTPLPPFLIYQGKPGQVQDTWLTDFDPEHQSAFFSTSETGWTSHELGKEWLVGVFDRFTKAKARNRRDYRLLITGGHSIHINMDFLDWCDAHRIIIAVFPPHSTHRLQPLDVSFSGPYQQPIPTDLFSGLQRRKASLGYPNASFGSCSGVHWKLLSLRRTSPVGGDGRVSSLSIRTSSYLRFRRIRTMTQMWKVAWVTPLHYKNLLHENYGDLLIMS